MSCLKNGECSTDQAIWCNGYKCVNGSIIVDDKKRDLGDFCSSSEECVSENCHKPSLNSLLIIGVPEHTCNKIGICTLQKSKIAHTFDFQ